MAKGNAQRQREHRQLVKERNEQPAEVRAAFQRVKIDVEIVDNRINVGHTFASVVDRATLEAWAASKGVTLDTLIDAQTRQVIAKHIKGGGIRRVE